MIVLAHFGHWYESVLYLVPLLLLLAALWWGGRDDDEGDVLAHEPDAPPVDVVAGAGDRHG